jgi:pimeloyl-ACP methyl ester carboxylesterase
MPHLNLLSKQLYYESIRVDHPRSEKTILVFLHEALGSIGQWRNFPTLLCQELKLNGLVYEREGHGKSSAFQHPRTANYLHEYALNELPLVIENLIGVDQQVILIGHSDGGSIALLYAAQFPKKVAATITMAAHVINEPETITGIQPAIEAYNLGKLEGLKKFHGDKTEDLFFAWANIWKSADFKDWNICQDISEIKAPLLALQGSRDQYGTIKQLLLIEESVNGIVETQFLDACGHHPHLEKMELVIGEVKRFLEGIVGN